MSGTVTFETLVFLLTIISGTAGIVFWFFKLIAGAKAENAREIAQVKEELAVHKLYAANNYATRESVNKELDRVNDKLDRIDDKLDRVLEK